MEHVLDNPAWNALISGNKQFASGNDDIRFFDADMSPFVGLKNNTATDFKALYNLVPHSGPVCVISPCQLEVGNDWATAHLVKGLQMVCEAPAFTGGINIEAVPLAPLHIPAMLTLTRLTRPGPFGEKTIDFGHYHGIFDKDKLVAMAGQRLQAFNYMEISAVCTHPHYLGRGYAQQLLRHQVARIKAASGIPFLHVRYDNERAISVYERLGFVVRKEIYFYFLRKNE